MLKTHFKPSLYFYLYRLDVWVVFMVFHFVFSNWSCFKRTDHQLRFYLFSFCLYLVFSLPFSLSIPFCSAQSSTTNQGTPNTLLAFAPIAPSNLSSSSSLHPHLKLNLSQILHTQILSLLTLLPSKKFTLLSPDIIESRLADPLNDLSAQPKLKMAQTLKATHTIIPTWHYQNQKHHLTLALYKTSSHPAVLLRSFTITGTSFENLQHTLNLTLLQINYLLSPQLQQWLTLQSGSDQLQDHLKCIQTSPKCLDFQSQSGEALWKKEQNRPSLQSRAQAELEELLTLFKTASLDLNQRIQKRIDSFLEEYPLYFNHPTRLTTLLSAYRNWYKKQSSLYYDGFKKRLDTIKNQLQIEDPSTRILSTLTYFEEQLDQSSFQTLINPLKDKANQLKASLQNQLKSKLADQQKGLSQKGLTWIKLDDDSVSRIKKGWSELQSSPFVSQSEVDFSTVGLLNQTPFEVSRSEITVAQYRTCVQNKKCTPPDFMDVYEEILEECTWSDLPAHQENKPMNCIPWENAREFARWVGGDLPTEVQWLFIAHHTFLQHAKNSDIHLNPCQVANGRECEFNRPHQCCSKQDDTGGICDLIGNVGEWLLDHQSQSLRFNHNPYCVLKGCTQKGSKRLVRGGDFAKSFHFGLSYRSFVSEYQIDSNIGFRIVRPLR